ncbi:putative tyrosinase [Rhypophila sp. PSN 637]
MKTTTFLGSALAAALSVNGLPSVNSRAVNDDLVEPQSLVDMIEAAKAQVIADVASKETEMRKRGVEPTCTVSKLKFRREYGDLTRAQRLAYVNAVKCLMALPPRTPADVAPGATSRFDDFIVVHIQRTMDVHFTGNFQPWHRWYLHQYEKALREECGYTGVSPYWDWPKYAAAPQDSPIFNGDEYSLGGNGEYIPGHPGQLLAPPPGVVGEIVQLPPGLGGGEVKTGPFANMTITLGPVAGIPNVPPGPMGGLGMNPRKLKRDVGPGVNMMYANYTSVLHMLSQPNIDAYRFVLEGIPHTTLLGPHGGGHFTIGGDPGGDVFISPGDPAFYLHHGNVDRMWAVWQALGGHSASNARYTDLGSGEYAHITWTNSPPSRLAELTDVLDMGHAAESTTIGNVMSTTGGELCYFYL